MATLPAYVRKLIEGFDKDRASTSIRSSMEDGMQKQAQFQSRALVKRAFTFQLDTLTNYNDFITWYKNEIKYGADWFTWTDPESGLTQTVRIVGGKLKKEEIIFGTQIRRVQVDLEHWE